MAVGLETHARSPANSPQLQLTQSPAHSPTDGQNERNVIVPGVLPAQPVQLFSIGDDPCVRHLQVSCRDQVGVLFKLCEILTSHGIDIRRAAIETENGIVNNLFDLHTSRPSHFADANDWCQELEEFLARSHEAGSAEPSEGSLMAISKKLSVNPDLLSVVCFSELVGHDGPPNELRYNLELEGINQAGLLAYASLVFVRSGFSVLRASISTTDGHFSDSFELSTLSPEAEHRLRSYLVVPTLLSRGYTCSLPFQATKSDADLVGFLKNWSGLSGSPNGSCVSLSTLCSPRVVSPELVPAASSHSQFDDLADKSLARSQNSSLSLVVMEEQAAEMRPSHVQAGVVKPGRCRNNSGLRKVPSLPELPEDGMRSPGPRSPVQRTTSINFSNGDMYEGNSRIFEDGEKRHGFGSYLYANSHDTYKQYRGQWREDKKHGHGVLFYRNGGVYAGQWLNNQKHGLGVLLDHSGQGNGQTVMPQCRYEGQWVEDMPHGLGVEENEKSSFFGHFNRGAQEGRGVHMDICRPGVICSEAVDGSLRLPLLEALELELVRLQQTSGRLGPEIPSELSSMTYHFGTSNEVRPSLGSIVFDDSTSGTHGTGSPGSSGNDSGGFAKSSSGTDRPPARPKGLPFRSPDVHSPKDERTPKLLHGSRSWGPSWGPVLSPMRDLTLHSRAASSGCIAGGATLLDSPSPRHEQASLGVVAFSLNEENNLLSPPTKNDPIVDDIDLPGEPARLSAPCSPSGSSSRRPAPSPSSQRRAATAEYPQMNAVKGDPQVRVSPLLWSEDELAAFFASLGIETNICVRVQQHKLKGAVQLLEMSNSELRRRFGLQSPVERLVVRESLKRLLDADRWENKVRGHRACDLLSDSVLGEFLVPAQEMKLVDMISQGGYGTVYRGVFTPQADRCGFQANQAHQVAVKEMKGERRVRLHELLKEACVMASLKHPNICTFIGVCADIAGRKHCIVSQLMDGSLFDLIHQPFKLNWNGELTVKVVVKISKGICAGIAYLHMMSLVHADMKSSNILVDISSSTKLVPRICDFGHAAVRSFPAPHHRCGTPHWAAPEVLRGEALGPEADIYSFGVLLWEMLAQRLPHKGLSFGQVLASVGWAGWTPDLKQLPEMPSELYRLLKQCLSFLPADRPISKDLQKRLRHMSKKANIRASQLLEGFFGQSIMDR